MAKTSYPFLACANALGLPYALVLAYRDALIKMRAQEATHWGGEIWQLDCWETAAVAKLHGSPAAAAIKAALDAEEARQSKAAQEAHAA